MSKWDKLLTRICSLSKDLRFDELRKVLESYGYEINAPRSGSSHYTFRKAGCQPITIPKRRRIKTDRRQTIRGSTAGRGSRAYFEVRYCILQKEMQSNSSQIKEFQSILLTRGILWNHVFEGLIYIRLFHLVQRGEYF